MDPRRSLLDDDPTTPTREPENVFSDEFEEDFDFPGVADGFRPNVDRETNPETRPDDVPVRSVSAHYAAHPLTPALSPGASRNSTQKSRAPMDPFASPEDDDHIPQDRLQSLEFEREGLVRRSTSSTSSHVFARTDSPRFGAGPSHPYGMYQQGTMARSPSVATTSTIRAPARQSFSQNVPQHPYALYPQGVDDGMGDDDEDDTIQPVPQNPVPLGFPGLNQGYTRRIGPDGEDQDIVGEDGHTEQLPPYSRYPDDGPEKMPLLPTALHSRAPVAGTDPGMPLMHTALRPVPSPSRPQSMMDASQLDRQPSRNSIAQLALISSSSLSSSSVAGDSSSTDSLKKSWNEKTWRERRKTTICGIPCIWIMVVFGLICFILAVIGGAVGGFVAGNKHALKAASTTVTYYDARPIESPAGVAPPQGTFALTLGQPEEPQYDCLTYPDQQAAWDCNLAPNAALGVIVEPGPRGNGSGASIFYASFDTSISYGAQLSSMNTSFAIFSPVEDKDDPQNGPAFYFQQYYDKIVVVPDDKLSKDSGDSKRRRQAWIDPDFVVPNAWAERKQVIPAGEKPWFCVWNNTFLEGFIYIKQNVSATLTTSAPGTTSPPGNTSVAPSSLYPSTVGPEFPVSTTTPPEVTMTFSTGWTTATYTGPPASYTSWVSDLVESAQITGGDPHDDDNSHDGYGGGIYPHTKREISSHDPWSRLDVFPYIIKLEERRVPHSGPGPYCQQYQILDNGHAGPAPDLVHGGPIIFDLVEQDPSSPSSRKSKRKRTEPGGCHCQWMSGE